MVERASTYYDKKYFDWQSSIGEFGGWANQSKFNKFISSDSNVLDFGCGGGFLLKNIACRIYGRLERSWFQVRVVAEK